MPTSGLCVDADLASSVHITALRTHSHAVNNLFIIYFNAKTFFFYSHEWISSAFLVIKILKNLVTDICDVNCPFYYKYIPRKCLLKAWSPPPPHFIVV